MQQLQAAYEKLKKEVTRTWYTTRIQEIVKSINKQKDEISKVLIDMRVLQKDIAMLSDKLGRTFTVTDELIFKVGAGRSWRLDVGKGKAGKYWGAYFLIFPCGFSQDARKDDDVRKCYRFLASLHEDCNTLVELVESTGSVQRGIRDLEDQVRLSSPDIRSNVLLSSPSISRLRLKRRRTWRPTLSASPRTWRQSRPRTRR